MNCPKCTNLLGDDAKFCTKCGTKIEQTQKTINSIVTTKNTKASSLPSLPPVKKKKKIIDFIILLLAILCIALITFPLTFNFFHKIEYKIRDIRDKVRDQKRLKEYTASISNYKKAKILFEKFVKTNNEPLKAQYLKEISNLVPTTDLGCFAQAYLMDKENNPNLSRIIAFYTSATVQNPKFTLAYLQLGTTYIATGEYASAIKAFTKVIELEPNNEDVYCKRGEAYYQEGLYYDAINDFTKIIELKPTSEDIYYKRGKAYYERGAYNNAIEDFTKVIELEPNNEDIYYSRGEAYHKKGLYGNAIEDFTKVIELEPNNEDIYYSRGEAYHKKGLYGNAIKDFTKVIELEPNNKEAYYKRAKTYYKKGLYDNVIEDYTKIMKLEPNNKLMYYYRSEVYKKQGRDKEAEKDIKTLLEKNVDKKLNNIDKLKRIIENLDKSQKESILAAETIFLKLFSANDKNAEDGFRVFREFYSGVINESAHEFYNNIGLQNLLSELSDLVGNPFNNPIPAFEKLDNEKTIKIREKYESELYELYEYINCGISFSQGEGSWYFEESSNFLLNKVLSNFNFELKEYIAFLSVENKERLAEDAGLLVSWEELRKRLIRWEEFAKQHPKLLETETEVKPELEELIYAYLMGMDNTSAYNLWETGKIETELLESYKTFLIENKTSSYYFIIDGTYNILKKHEFKMNEELITFLNKKGYLECSEVQSLRENLKGIKN